MGTAAAVARDTEPMAGPVLTVPAAPRPPDGLFALLAWIVASDARTRRFRSLLSALAPIVVAVAITLVAVTLVSPLAGAALGGLLGVPAAAAARRRRS